MRQILKRYTVVLLFFFGAHLAQATPEMVETPITKTQIDISTARRLSRLDFEDAISELRALNIRVGIFENATLLEGLTADAKEISAFNDVLKSQDQKGIRIAALFYAKDQNILPSKVKVQEDTILMHKKARSFAHEYLHLILSKKRKTFLEQELLTPIEANQGHVKAMEYYTQLVGQGFRAPKNQDLNAESVAKNSKIIEAEVIAASYGAYYQFVIKIDELDVHTTLRKFELVSGDSNIIVAANHLASLKELVAKISIIVERYLPFKESLTPKTVKGLDNIGAIIGAVNRLEKTLGLTLQSTLTKEEKERLSIRPEMKELKAYLVN